MAKQFKEDLERADAHNLSVGEHAFYDALARNESAEELMGKDVLIEGKRSCGKTKRQPHRRLGG